MTHSQRSDPGTDAGQGEAPGSDAGQGEGPGADERQAAWSGADRRQADLHMHSTASDGKLSPGDVMREAAAAGVGLFSLTDHDTIDGLDEARTAAMATGARFVPGVEISARQEVEVHLLAYGFDEEHDALRSLLHEQLEARRRRGEKFVRVLIEAGALPESAGLDSAAAGQPASITRPHIADMLVEHGTVRDRREAFELFLIESAATFVPKPMPAGSEVMDVVHASGGIVSLAHPGHGVPHRVILSLIRSGLDAIEVVHPSHDGMLETYYRKLAETYGLLTTGGSDFHEFNGREGRDLGRMGFYPDEKLLRRLRTLPDA